MSRFHLTSSNPNNDISVYFNSLDKAKKHAEWVADTQILWKDKKYNGIECLEDYTSDQYFIIKPA
jgi:hypothetical protein